MDIYDKLMNENERYLLYEVRRKEYQSEEIEIPFRVSANPLKLEQKDKTQIIDLGNLIVAYMKAVIELYNTNEVVKEILDRGKDNIFRNANNPQYLFFRPDLILTQDGFKICEIETSIFGLALSEVLNKVYIDSNQETLVEQDTLKRYIISQIPKEGTIVYSSKVKAFRGQLEFLADEVFSDGKNNWKTAMVDERPVLANHIYRAFYSSDLKQEQIARLVKNKVNFVPTLTPQFEEKAVLAFIWDKRFIEYFRKKLGIAYYDYLKRLIPPTWILGEEENFELGMPRGINQVLELSNLPKGQRRLVLKKSGDSSWGEGILFLHKVSHEKIRHSLQLAKKSNALYVMQEFNEGKKVNMEFITKSGIESMNAKVRITPYYAFSGVNTGKLISIKATGCEKTEYIHGATNSINTSVS